MAVIRYCLNPKCLKRIRVTGRKSHCTQRCKREHYNIRYRNVMRVRQLGRYMETHNVEYKDLPYCKLCGVRSAKMHSHWVICHPEEDYEMYCWKNKAKLFDMNERGYIQRASDKGVETYNQQIDDINDYLKSLGELEEDDEDGV